MRVAIEAASLTLTSGGLARYTSELSLALARTFPDDDYFLVSDQKFATPPDAPDGWFEVCLIPETLKRTTLGTRQPGEVVNLEVDVIAKYVERMLSSEGDK